jgi:hypothetical protein
MRVEQLEYIAAVARLGSFRRTAATSAEADSPCLLINGYLPAP